MLALALHPLNGTRLSRMMMTDHFPEPTGNLPGIRLPYLPLYLACCPPAQSPGVETQEPDNRSTI